MQYSPLRQSILPSRTTSLHIPMLWISLLLLHKTWAVYNQHSIKWDSLIHRTCPLLQGIPIVSQTNLAFTRTHNNNNNRTFSSTHKEASNSNINHRVQWFQINILFWPLAPILPTINNNNFYSPILLSTRKLILLMEILMIRLRTINGMLSSNNNSSRFIMLSKCSSKQSKSTLCSSNNKRRSNLTNAAKKTAAKTMLCKIRHRSQTLRKRSLWIWN